MVEHFDLHAGVVLVDPVQHSVVHADDGGVVAPEEMLELVHAATLGSLAAEEYEEASSDGMRHVLWCMGSSSLYSASAIPDLRSRRYVNCAGNLKRECIFFKVSRV